MAKKVKQEWDWPDEKPSRSEKFVDAVPRGTGWASPKVTKAVNIYWRIIIETVKVIVAIILTGLLAGCIWLGWTIHNLP